MHPPVATTHHHPVLIERGGGIKLEFALAIIPDFHAVLHAVGTHPTAVVGNINDAVGERHVVADVGPHLDLPDFLARDGVVNV